MTVPHHAWAPITLPPDAGALELRELRAFAQLWARQRERHEVVERFNERMARWWSIETGVIERIYDLSAGATMLLVEQGFTASLVSHNDTNINPALLIEILGDHRDALEMVMDVVGGQRQLTVGWIKELHALLTRNQRMTIAKAPHGLVELELKRGEWKLLPNNPIRSDGALHEYCPPEHVSAEMDALVRMHGELAKAAPEVRAAWLHHAFTQIHPFKDGNGRVARALASIDLIKSGLFPLLVDRRDKSAAYLPALERADRGDLRPLVNFFGKCVERVLLRAISEAEAVVGPAASLAGVLDAASAKLAARKATQDEAKRVMSDRLPMLATIIRKEFSNAAERTKASLPNIRTKLFESNDGSTHYFRRQLTETAARAGHWLDFREPRHWVDLRIDDGGRTNIVASVHFIGNPSPGSCAATVFLQHRELEEGIASDETPVDVGVESLLLVSEEAQSEQERRVEAWAQYAVLQSLSQWTRYL